MAIKLSISSPLWEFSTNWVCLPEFSFIATIITLLEWRTVSNTMHFKIWKLPAAESSHMFLMHIISISECSWYCKKIPNYWRGKTGLRTPVLLVFKQILKTIYLKIFNKMLVCCKLRPIVFNFPFRRNQFLPKRHFSGSLANSSELIFSFLDPFLQLVAHCVLLSFRIVI